MTSAAGTERGDSALTAEGLTIRPLDLADAAELAALNERNRVDIERVSPAQPPDAFTAQGQATRVHGILREMAAGARQYWTIWVDGELAGDISLHAIHRGAVQTANVGYMVDSTYRGRGVATTALRLVIQEAFGRLRLHRLDAGVMPANVGSQRVLEKAGFSRVGLLRRYLYLAGSWEDHVLYELVGEDFVPPA